MSKGFRVTVEDLETGDKQAMEVAVGDYVLIPFAPCFLEHTQRHPAAGTVVLTIKNHRPQGGPKVVTGEQTTEQAPEDSRIGEIREALAEWRRTRPIDDRDAAVLAVGLGVRLDRILAVGSPVTETTKQDGADV